MREKSIFNINLLKAIAQSFVLFLSTLLPGYAIGQPTSTWQIIQQKILNPNCAYCHFEGSSFARQSDLVLTSDVAYENIVDVAPHNSAAKEAKLLRVSSTGNQAAPHRSFLWEKINAADQRHFYSDHPEYGALMPLGQQSLTNGEILFIRQWIELGAPKEEIVVNESLLDDTTRYEPPEFEALSPPPAGEGYQFHLEPFNVWPSEKWDREFLYFESLQTSEDIFIKQYEIAMRPGSHHFIMYNYPTGKAIPTPNIFRDMRSATGNSNISTLLELNSLFPHQFFLGTQTPYTNYSFPEGVALRLPAGHGFDLNSHSVNRSGQTQIGEIYVNLYTAQAEEIRYPATYTNFNNTKIYLPAKQITTIEHDGYFQETRHIIQMWSHSHESTMEFSIKGIGGQYDNELLYWTNDWQHPPFLQLDPPLTMHAGEGLKLITTYNNQTDKPIQFGPLSSDEMQFVFYIYYTGNITSTTSGAPVPKTYQLMQNFPNPFNPETTIRYHLPERSNVTLQIFNITGKSVITLVNWQQNPGEKAIQWNGKDSRGKQAASGLYFYRLRANGFEKVRKLTLLR